MAPVGEKTGKPSKSRSPGFPTVLNEFARDTNIEGVNNAGSIYCVMLGWL